MKKLIPFALTAALALPLVAEEEIAPVASVEAVDTKADIEQSREYVVWPAFAAICEWPTTPELIGIRFTIPWSTKQETVTGLDLGFWGRSRNFEGIAINIIGSDVKDTAAGILIGLANFVDQSSMFGLQVGLWNESRGINGFQVGLVNVAGDINGLQVGLFNRTETMHGYQVGLINIIRDSDLQFMPVVNIGF